MRNRTLPFLAFVLPLLAFGAHALPDFFAKPPTWRSMLVTNDDKTVSDADFAQLVLQTQTNIKNTVKMVEGREVHHNSFAFLASFTQCFGGGFITELRSKGVTNYGANSASTYFEPASYNLKNNPPNSFYPFAWTTLADYPAGAAKPTDEWVTWKAYDALDTTKPVVRMIPKNPDYPVERAQYLSDRNGVPQPLGAAQHSYAVLWVGKPHVSKADYNDVNKLYDLLVSPKYKLKPADVQILWADKVDPNAADAWKPTGKAEWADLQAAFKTVENAIKLLPYEDSYQVFFYAGDHGNADFPITITVTPPSQGLPGTGVNLMNLGTGRNLYEAGAGTNQYLLTEQTAGQPLQGLSFGDDFQNAGTLFKSYYASPTAVLYFSADNPSAGLPGTELNGHRAAGEQQGPNVYAKAASGNRLLFHGRRNLGLVTGAASDELNDFVMRDMRDMLGQNGLPTRPVFFTNAQDSRIWVHDPKPPAVAGRPKTYVYYDFGPDYPLPQGPPRLVDALAMRVNLGHRNLATDRLIFDKQNDYIVFSVGRNEMNAPWNAYKPCDLLVLGGGRLERMWAPCNFLGLDPRSDNVDGLDLGAGKYFQPVSFQNERPWPDYDYPNEHRPEDEPEPNYPLPPDPPSP